MVISVTCGDWVAELTVNDQGQEIPAVEQAFLPYDARPYED